MYLLAETLVPRSISRQPFRERGWCLRHRVGLRARSKLRGDGEVADQDPVGWANPLRLGQPFSVDECAIRRPQVGHHQLRANPGEPRVMFGNVAPREHHVAGRPAPETDLVLLELEAARTAILV